MQPKLNGHRCLIANVDGEIIPYTRKGKPILTIPHIVQDFSWLPPGKTVDGELYVHGRTLQSISSLIKRQQDGSSLLRYHWYDYISELPFDLRYHGMRGAADQFSMPNVQLVPTYTVSDMHEVFELFRAFRNDGYEGAMLRRSTAGYQANVRAAQLLKVKERLDTEVTVRSATRSKDGWAILRVVLDNGKEFDVSAPGSINEKLEVMQNIDKYIGRRLTIEFAEWTADGIPFHAVATSWFEEL